MNEESENDDEEKTSRAELKDLQVGMDYDQPLCDEQHSLRLFFR